MRRTGRWAAAIAAGVVAGIGGAVLLDAATGPAGAQDAFTVTPAQLKVNQRISAAAVRRSNQALNYLAPVRTAQTDAADTGSNGVRNGNGGGWGTAQIADGAITPAKLSDGLRAGQTRWIVKVNNDMGVPVTRASASGITMTRLATGTYLSDFGSDIRACNWTATPTVDSGVPAAMSVRTMPDPGGSIRKVLVETFNGAGFLVDSGVGVQVFC